MSWRRVMRFLAHLQITFHGDIFDFQSLTPHTNLLEPKEQHVTNSRQHIQRHFVLEGFLN